MLKSYCVNCDMFTDGELRSETHRGCSIGDYTEFYSECGCGCDLSDEHACDVCGDKVGKPAGFGPKDAIQHICDDCCAEGDDEPAVPTSHGYACAMLADPACSPVIHFSDRFFYCDMVSPKGHCCTRQIQAGEPYVMGPQRQGRHAIGPLRYCRHCAEIRQVH